MVMTGGPMMPAGGMAGGASGMGAMHGQGPMADNMTGHGDHSMDMERCHCCGGSSPPTDDGI
jgi:hypothetical protein